MFNKSFYTIKNISLIAIIAALYAGLSLLISPLSFGPIQLRFSEILILLCFYKKEYSISMVVGCFITNLFSPFALDIILGTFHTLLSVILISYSKNLLIASFWPTILSFIIGYELYLYGEPFFVATLSVMIGEFIVVTCIGVILFSRFEKKNYFKEFISKSFKEK